MLSKHSQLTSRQYDYLRTIPTSVELKCCSHDATVDRMSFLHRRSVQTRHLITIIHRQDYTGLARGGTGVERTAYRLCGLNGVVGSSGAAKRAGARSRRTIIINTAI